MTLGNNFEGGVPAPENPFVFNERRAFDRLDEISKQLEQHESGEMSLSEDEITNLKNEKFLLNNKLVNMGDHGKFKM